jgi:hypothetical protein
MLPYKRCIRYCCGLTPCSCFHEAWMGSSENNRTKRNGVDGTIMAQKMYWARVNLVIAGITQLLAEKEHIEAVVNEASKLGAYDPIKRLQHK